MGLSDASGHPAKPADGCP